MDDVLSPVAAIVAACRWRPIDTAPKDGTIIVLRVGPYVPAVGKYEGGWCIGDPFGVQHPYSPTHWMPLPPWPPED